LGLKTFIVNVVQGVENTSEWVLGKAFSAGKADVYDFVRELIQVMEHHKQRLPENIFAPNRYTLRLRSDLYRGYRPLIEQYERDLAKLLEKEIAERKYCMKGHLVINFIDGGDEQPDEIEVECAISADTIIVAGRALLVDEAQTYEISRGKTTIGRDSANDIVISDGHVSRQHAEIDRTGSEFFLKDLSSRNYTFLNGDRIEAHQSVKLSDGDKVSFAGVEFVFKYYYEGEC